MAIGGNRFGSSYGGGGMDSLDRLQMRNTLMSNMGTRKRRGSVAGGGQAGPAGFTVGPTNGMVSSSSLPSAEETKAFNERIRDKMKYGSIWKSDPYGRKSFTPYAQREMDTQRDLQTSKNKGLLDRQTEENKAYNYRTDKDFEARQARTQAEAKSRAVENRGKFGGMDEYGRPLQGTEVRKAGAMEKQAEAQTISARARQGLRSTDIKERVSTSPEGGTKTDYLRHGMTPDGREAMIPIPVHDPNTPTNAQPKDVGKKKKKDVDPDSYLNY